VARPDPPPVIFVTQGEPTIVISWDAIVGATSYTIYRSPVQVETGYVIGRTGETSWTDTTAAANTIYWYSVSVTVSSSGCSVPSNQVSGYSSSVPITVPDTPANLMAIVAP